MSYVSSLAAVSRILTLTVNKSNEDSTHLYLHETLGRKKICTGKEFHCFYLNPLKQMLKHKQIIVNIFSNIIKEKKTAVEAL